jgi:hypothetical protein
LEFRLGKKNYKTFYLSALILYPNNPFFPLSIVSPDEASFNNFYKVFETRGVGKAFDLKDGIPLSDREEILFEPMGRINAIHVMNI